MFEVEVFFLSASRVLLLLKFKELGVVGHSPRYTRDNNLFELEDVFLYAWKMCDTEQDIIQKIFEQLASISRHDLNWLIRTFFFIVTKLDNGTGIKFLFKYTIVIYH